ncbi:hypothetical protein K458DRAFT_321123 [Lentithecium fluviatile CBS 122367]|uniref:Amidohydrolase-related domain-containing protein n=1 Tax=Lentithecium fluviatile CBS 122367 TaxID=1168545 RepID=A0A6G1IF03_9PLEO|nr:hypothetical protein K458DRAFT_321123 [Lentithecium fluviatile CBS 122367]
MRFESPLELSAILSFTNACFHHDSFGEPSNYVRRSIPSPLEKTAIMNVRVFDGDFMSAPRTVFIEDDRISASPQGVNHTIDGTGRFLVPGFIDSHLHLRKITDLETLSSYGVTTALQISCQNYTAYDKLRGHDGLTDFYTAALQAWGANGIHAENAVRRGDPTTRGILVDIKRHGQLVTPTIATDLGSASLSNVYATVHTMYKAGVPTLARTDAVGQVAANVSHPFGSSLHQELQNLVYIGMIPAEAMDAATRVPAMFHRLNDRGFIAPGMRADLLLLNSNPLVNISNTLDIERVWIGGRQYPSVTGQAKV